MRMVNLLLMLRQFLKPLAFREGFGKHQCLHVTGAGFSSQAILFMHRALTINACKDLPVQQSSGLLFDGEQSGFAARDGAIRVKPICPGSNGP